MITGQVKGFKQRSDMSITGPFRKTGLSKLLVRWTGKKTRLRDFTF